MAQHGRTIYQLAKGARIAWPTALRYVTGEHARPSKEIAARIAAWTGGALSSAQVAGHEEAA